ncbi:MAG TPA: hypothetical protein VMU04_16745 [Candidatus Acidoferrum sp.]|nr:hypothetical protein [Candidatus Acidoferrum sp.]
MRFTSAYQSSAAQRRLALVAIIALLAFLVSCSERNADDLDVHGNGLTRYAERVLGVDPLAPTNPLVLIPVVTGQEPFVLTYEVPVRTDLGSNRCELSLWDNGQCADTSEIERRTNGTYLVTWDTLFAAFGQHALQLRLGVPYQSLTNVFGPKRMEDVTNLVQFDPASTSFGSRIFIEGKLQCRSANYKIDFFDMRARLLRTIWGHTDKGIIKQGWDLQDADGQVRNDTEFQANIYIAPTPVGATNSPSSNAVFTLPPYPLRFWRAGRMS